MKNIFKNRVWVGISVTTISAIVIMLAQVGVPRVKQSSLMRSLEKMGMAFGTWSPKYYLISDYLGSRLAFAAESVQYSGKFSQGQEYYKKAGETNATMQNYGPLGDLTKYRAQIYPSLKLVEDVLSAVGSGLSWNGSADIDKTLAITASDGVSFGARVVGEPVRSANSPADVVSAALDRKITLSLGKTADSVAQAAVIYYDGEGKVSSSSLHASAEEDSTGYLVARIDPQNSFEGASKAAVTGSLRMDQMPILDVQAMWDHNTGSNPSYINALVSTKTSASETGFGTGTSGYSGTGPGMMNMIAHYKEKMTPKGDGTFDAEIGITVKTGGSMGYSAKYAGVLDADGKPVNVWTIAYSSLSSFAGASYNHSTTMKYNASTGQPVMDSNITAPTMPAMSMNEIPPTTLGNPTSGAAAPFASDGKPNFDRFNSGAQTTSYQAIFGSGVDLKSGNLGF